MPLDRIWTLMTMAGSVSTLDPVPRMSSFRAQIRWLEFCDAMVTVRTDQVTSICEALSPVPFYLFMLATSVAASNPMSACLLAKLRPPGTRACDF